MINALHYQAFVQNDSLSVLFDVLNAEPVISGSTLSFINNNVNKDK